MLTLNRICQHVLGVLLCEEQEESVDPGAETQSCDRPLRSLLHKKPFFKSPSALCKEELLGRFSYSEKLFDNVLKSTCTQTLNMTEVEQPPGAGREERFT